MRSCSACGRQWAATLERCPEDGALLVDAAGAVTLAATGTGDVVAVAPPPFTDELAAGTKVGEYEIEKLIGSGGMGMVYGARHPLIGKRAAIKVLHAAMSVDREAVARFVQEAQAVNRIGHANIVDIFSFGTLPDGRAYFAMEWLQGQTLAARIQRGLLPISDAATILLALVRALEAAHAAGVIHRDLKPENVFLITDDDSFRVKLLDFGIAKLSKVQQPTSRTATGITVGTPLYMSPEQARGTDIDARTDLYSLGIVAYEMLCGKTPFDGEASAVEVLHAHLAKSPRSPRELRADVPSTFDELILRLLSKRADERPPLAEVRQRLAIIATRSSPISIPAETVASNRVVEDDTVPARRRVGPYVAIGIPIAIMGVVAIVALSRGPHAETERVAKTPAPEEAPAPPQPPPVIQAPATAAAPSAPAAPPPLATASIDLVIEPASATVAIDGKAVKLEHGRAHLEVGPGEHDVGVRATGYRSIEQKFDAVAGKPNELRFRLVKLPVTPVRPTKPTTDRDGVVDPFRRK